MSIVWLDGELVDKADAKIGVADHGLLFGDGVTADMRAYSGRVFRLSEHFERLQAWADDIGLSLPIAGNALATAVDATLKANHRTDGFVKVVVTRGAGPLTLDPRKCVPVTLILTEEAAPFPRDVYECGLDVVAVPISAFADRPTLSVAERVRVKLTALRSGCLEGLVVEPTTLSVICGSETDLAWVSGSDVRFAPGGVTHNAVAELAGVGGRPWARVADLLAADEVFLTSAAAEIIAVRSIDGQAVGSGGQGPVVRRLRQEFAAMVRRECAVS